MLNYAETHFKFPISRLFRREPDILIDVPFQVLPNEQCPFYLVARNTDKYPIIIKEIYGTWFSANQNKFEFRLPFEKKLTEHFHFEPLEILPPLNKVGYWQLRIFIKYQINGKEKVCERWNYPYLPPKPLLIHFLENPEIKPQGWLAGETHCHSNYTASVIEFGAETSVLQKAAKTIGLDFVCITDHSYDLTFELMDKLKQEIKNLNTESKPLMILGEEVSCGNAKGENVHLLVYDNDDFIEGHGDGGKKKFNTKPNFSIQEVIAKSKYPCFVAHPKLDLLFIEKLLLRRGKWHLQDIREIAGIEFWNGCRDRSFYEGRELWISCLLSGADFLPWGGNDAHGDLNSWIAIKKPLWSIKCTQEHVFGQTRTVLEPDTEKSTVIETILHTKNLYLTEGPSLYFIRENNKALLYAESNSDYGNFLWIRVFSGKKNREKENIIFQKENIKDFKFEQYFDLEDNGYIRAECETDRGKFALTKAVWGNKNC